MIVGLLACNLLLTEQVVNTSTLGARHREPTSSSSEHAVHKLAFLGGKFFFRYPSSSSSEYFLNRMSRDVLSTDKGDEAGI